MFVFFPGLLSNNKMNPNILIHWDIYHFPILTPINQENLTNLMKQKQAVFSYRNVMTNNNNKGALQFLVNLCLFMYIYLNKVEYF